MVSRTRSAGVGDDQRDTIKTVIISFITISLTGEPNSPFSFNLPNENFGLVPYSRTGSILNKKIFFRLKKVERDIDQPSAEIIIGLLEEAELGEVCN